ncbi:MAG: lysostaphin resistance A-like protein [Flammeovirgaceae bacterium]
MSMKGELRSFWSRYFSLNWKFGLCLLLLICIPRFVLVLKANETGNYSFIGLIMFISALIPFLFLNRHGLQKIGIKKTKQFHVLAYALILGLAFSLLLHFLGIGLFGNSYENWYVYIGKSYNIPESIAAQDKQIMFIIMAITGMTFSPIGEEFFFRGIVHGSFAKSIGAHNASLIDSLAFALTHISHFGLVFVNNQWDFYLLPTLIWVLGMFVVSLLFFKMKQLANSIWGAVLCHAGFNLGMIYCIFYLL